MSNGKSAARVSPSPGGEGRGEGERSSDFKFDIRHSAFGISKIARAVHHAHQRGVLHRDLKPANILIDAQGEPHITDFGLARQIGVESSLTHTGSSLGTPAYMSPEQARGEKDVTTASDVWSLGAMLYHLLAGRPPFAGNTAMEVLRKVMEEEVGPPGRVKSEIRSPRSERSPKPEIRNEAGADVRVRRSDFGFFSVFGFRPSDLDIICLKCLEKDPARRYTSARALAEDLERWLNHEPIRARPSSSGERFVKWARRNPARATLATALLVISLVGIAGITWQWRRAERNARAERASSQQAREQLWNSLLAQARAGRLSGQFGSKRAGLEAIAAAARIRPAPELRDEAIAHLALFDLEPDPHAHRQTNYLRNPTFDSEGLRCADLDSDAGMLRIFRTTDDAEVARWLVPKGTANPRFSSQDRYLWINSGDDMIVLDARTGRELYRQHKIRRARFNPDDTVLAVVGTDHVIRFVEADTGKALPFQLTPPKSEDALVWSPDGNTVALAIENTVEIWDWRNSTRTPDRIKHDAYVVRLIWERECLAIGDERGGIQLWNSRTKKSRKLGGHDSRTDRLHLNGAGTVLASHSWDGTSRFWSTVTGKLLLSTDHGLVYCFSRDGSRVCYRTPGGWGMWQVDAPQAFRLISVGDQRLSLVSTADLSPDNSTLLLAASGSSLLLMDLASEHVTKLPLRDVRVAWFMPDGRTIFTSGYAQGLSLWPLDISTNATTGDRTALLGPARTVPGATWKDSDSAGLSDDGRFAGTRISSREVVVMDLKHTNRITRLIGVRQGCRPTFSADHRWIVTASEGGGGPNLWEADTGRFVRLLHPHRDNGGAQFSPDGRVLVTTDPSGVRFYDASTWQVIRHLPAAHGTPLAGSAAFTPDSRLAAFTIGQRELRLADPRTGEVLATLTSPEPRPINSLRFSRDGRLLAVATATDAVDLWDIALIDEELKKLGLGLPR